MSAPRVRDELSGEQPDPALARVDGRGRFLEAAKLASDSTPIAEICARLCPRDHLCEDACILNGPAEPVSIGAIEEFLAEYGLAHGVKVMAVAPANGWKVAVLGTGVAGLACASELVRRGYSG
jgi:glutamate synthase (NADPH/NADH) small chain